MATKTRLTLVAAAGLLIIAAVFIVVKTILSSERNRELQGAVVILLDTVRADHLSCYGYERDTAPELTALARKGVLFEKTVSASPWTLPSVVSFLAGHRPTPAIYEGHLKQSLVESIRDAGFATAAFTEGGFVSAHYGLDLGFTEFREEEGPVQLLDPGEAPDQNATGCIENTFRRAREWLAAHRNKKFFLFIHTYEPHVPYTRTAFTGGMNPGKVGGPLTIDMLTLISEGDLVLDDTDLSYIEALYDGGILESDRHVGAFVDYLDELGLSDKTLLVVTSDHGEELGAHYRTLCADHGHALLDEQVLVPLIVRNPKESYPEKRIAHQVRLWDVMPTAAEILGADADPGCDGKSLLPLMRGEERQERVADGGETKKGPLRVFLRWLDYKYIRVIGPGEKEHPMTHPPPVVQLYYLKEDPGERKNVAEEKPDIVRLMQNKLCKIIESKPGESRFLMPDEKNETLRKRIESLGYGR